MQKQLDMLKFVCEHDIVRDEAEKLISNFNSKFKVAVGYNQISNISHNFDVAVSDLAHHLHASYRNLNDFSYLYNSILCYIAMDKKIYPYLIGSKIKHPQFKIDFIITGSKHIPNKSHLIYGSQFEDFYRFEDGYKEVINFLNDYVDIFPYSSRKYINNKIKEKAKKPKIDKITNPFEAKVFSKSFDKKFVKAKFDTWLKFFRNSGSEFEQLWSIFYFYTSVEDFYSGSEYEEASKTTLDECMISFSHNLKIICRRISLFQQSESMLKTAKIIQSNPNFLKSLIKYASSHEWYDNSLYFLSKIVISESDINDITNAIGKNISKTHTHRPLVWKNMSFELQSSLIEEAKRQFFVDLPEFDINI